VNIELMKTIDSTLGALLIRIISARTSGGELTPHSFLIIRPGGIGDAVQLVLTVNELKRRYPEALITILAEKRNAVAFKLCPHVSRVLHYDKPWELLTVLCGDYDVVIDTEQWHRLSAVVARLTGAPVSIGYATNERKKLFAHRIPYSHDDYEKDSFLKLLAPLGIAGAVEMTAPFLQVPAAAKIGAEALLSGLAAGSFVTIFPGASIPERRWGTEKFKAVAERLHAKDISVVVVGGKVDEIDGGRIVGGNYGLNLAGKTSLAETAAIIEKSSVLISGDSGILHIGVGLCKPTVSLFGPGIAKKWAPRGERHMVINKNLPCSPCTKFGYTPKCPIHAKCMADITVDEVVEAVMRLMESNFEF
jgi:ADP-heptose:LPS heptosyltransferase